MAENNWDDSVERDFLFHMRRRLLEKLYGLDDADSMSLEIPSDMVDACIDEIVPVHNHHLARVLGETPELGYPDEILPGEDVFSVIQRGIRDHLMEAASEWIEQRAERASVLPAPGM